MKQNYLFHRNLRFQKFIKPSPSVLPGCGTRIKLICTPANLFPQPPHSGCGNATHYTLANSNLHQPFELVSFTWFLRVNNIEKMYKRDAKYEITLTRNLITSSYYYKYIFNLTIKKIFFYYLRYPHDIRMKYCGCGCQNSCGYPRMRIRMRSSDTPLI